MKKKKNPNVSRNENNKKMELRDLLYGNEFKNDLYLEFEVESHKNLSFDHDNDFILITNLDPTRYGGEHIQIYTDPHYQIYFDEKKVYLEHNIENVCTSAMLMEANFESFCAYMLFRKENKFLVYFDDLLLYETNVWKYFLKRLKQRYNNSLIRVVKYIYKTTLPLNIRVAHKEYFNKNASLDFLKTLVDNDVTPDWKPYKRYHIELVDLMNNYRGKGIYTLFKWIESFVDLKKKKSKLMFMVMTPELLEHILIYYPDFDVYWYCTYFPGAAKLIHYYQRDKTRFEDFLLSACVKRFLGEDSKYFEDWFWCDVKEIVGPTKRVVILPRDFENALKPKYITLINAGLCGDWIVKLCLLYLPNFILKCNRYTIKYFKNNKSLLTLFCCLKRIKIYDLRFIIGRYFLK